MIPWTCRSNRPSGLSVEIAVEEDDLNTLAAQFVDQDHLIGVIPCQAVGALDVEPVDGPGGGRVAQPLQGGREQGLSRIAIVDESEFLGDGQAVAEDPPIQQVELTGDGVVFDLLIIGDPGVHGSAGAGGFDHERAPEADRSRANGLN